MKKSLDNLNQLVESNNTAEALHFSNDIYVSEELLIEIGYEIQSSWEDGRIHIDSDGTLLEASLVNTQGEVNKFLKITMQDLVRNAEENTPYLKKASPLMKANAGKYSIIIRATTLCVFLSEPHNYFLFSITPLVKIYADSVCEPVVDEKYPLDCNLVGNETTGDEIVKGWSIYYKEDQL
ncbi:hypothetical protein [Bacillus thuringiensis]|uniref:hypothetical protein n=1 Tax=Bacillus thuringiensis TaxID=1428 RepID=UPI000BFBB640|nr:hypothetical protein [Bacillus thuringiensis]PGV86832.1 hypothetical protein COD85_10315 [Bacillus thuringiensis]